MRPPSVSTSGLAAPAMRCDLRRDRRCHICKGQGTAAHARNLPKRAFFILAAQTLRLPSRPHTRLSLSGTKRYRAGVHTCSFSSAFTILEILVASTVLILILGVILSTISQTSDVTRRATSKISSFQGARAAFDLMTEKLGQATLNSYWDYDNPASPTRYLRKSELHFLIGNAGTDPFGGTSGTGQAVYFQAPAGVSTTFDGLETLLNAVGFFITYGDEEALPSPLPAAAQKYRYRLMQAVQSAESLGVYNGTTGNAWATSVKDSAVPVAENIIYMVAWPRKAPTEDPQGAALTSPPNGSSYTYDSRLNATSITQPETANQMPPMVQITIVAIDETSAARFCTASTPPTEIFNAFTQLFQTSNQVQLDADITTLKSNLDAAHINSRIFTAIVPIRESKMQ